MISSESKGEGGDATTAEERLVLILFPRIGKPVWGELQNV
jgi:hypothetical protein